MGWKSTLDLTRDEAISLIHKRLSSLDEFSDLQLTDLIEGLGYGEDIELTHYGHNFSIVD